MSDSKNDIFFPKKNTICDIGRLFRRLLGLKKDTIPVCLVVSFLIGFLFSAKSKYLSDFNVYFECGCCTGISDLIGGTGCILACL